MTIHINSFFFFFFSSRRRHTRSLRDWSSDVCSSDLQIVQKSSDRLKVRLSLPQAMQPGFYKLRARGSGTPVPNTLIFEVSDRKEVVLNGSPPAGPVDWRVPVVFNGAIRNPKQTDNFWVDVKAGDQITVQADGMSLGNFLDPAVTIFDTA